MRTLSPTVPQSKTAFNKLCDLSTLGRDNALSSHQKHIVETMLKTETKSLKCVHYVMVESLNIQGVEEDWQLKVLQETDNL
jgi:hypothetical protein